MYVQGIIPKKHFSTIFQQIQQFYYSCHIWVWWVSCVSPLGCCCESLRCSYFKPRQKWKASHANTVWKFQEKPRAWTERRTRGNCTLLWRTACSYSQGCTHSTTSKQTCFYLNSSIWVSASPTNEGYTYKKRLTVLYCKQNGNADLNLRLHLRYHHHHHHSCLTDPQGLHHQSHHL